MQPHGQLVLHIWQVQRPQNQSQLFKVGPYAIPYISLDRHFLVNSLIFQELNGFCSTFCCFSSFSLLP